MPPDPPLRLPPAQTLDHHLPPPKISKSIRVFFPPIQLSRAMAAAKPVAEAEADAMAVALERIATACPSGARSPPGRLQRRRYGYGRLRRAVRRR